MQILKLTARLWGGARHATSARACDLVNCEHCQFGIKRVKSVNVHFGFIDESSHPCAARAAPGRRRGCCAATRFVAGSSVLRSSSVSAKCMVGRPATRRCFSRRCRPCRTVCDLRCRWLIAARRPAVRDPRAHHVLSCCDQTVNSARHDWRAPSVCLCEYVCMWRGAAAVACRATPPGECPPRILCAVAVPRPSLDVPAASDAACWTDGRRRPAGIQLCPGRWRLPPTENGPVNRGQFPQTLPS